MIKSKLYFDTNEPMESEHSISFIADFDGNEETLFDNVLDPTIPILPLRNMVLFPGIVLPVSVGRKSSLRLIKDAFKQEKAIGVFCQRSSETEEPQQKDLYETGTAARVVRIFEMPDQTTTVILQGMQRLRLTNVVASRPYLMGEAESLNEVLPKRGNREFKAIVDNCKDLAVRLIKSSEDMQPDAAFAIKNISNGMFLVNFVSSNLPFDIKEKMQLLHEESLQERATRLLAILNREVQLADLKASIQMRTREDLDQQQREYFLQQQIKNIQDELGGGQDSEMEELRAKGAEKKWSKEVAELFEKEVTKLERINPQSPDYNVQLTYLQTLLALPWGVYTTDNLSIVNAEKTLNKDHYGLEKVKERILEHLAVLKLKDDMKSPIICLYGPPGVGKTSLGRSIAASLKRKYVRMSLGGVHDEAEIRGHRRTYIGAMPGRIINALTHAGSKNALLLFSFMRPPDSSQRQKYLRVHSDRTL